MDSFETQVRLSFAKAIKAARIREGWPTAASFAEAAGVEAPTYRSWERGGSMPDLKMLGRLCALLNVEPNDLLPLAFRAGHEFE